VNSLIDGHSSFNVGIYGSGLGFGVRCQPLTADGYLGQKSEWKSPPVGLLCIKACRGRTL